MKKSKKIPKYPFGGLNDKDKTNVRNVLGNSFRATGDVGLSMLGMDNVIKDSDYKGNSAKGFMGYSDVMGGIGKAILPAAANIVLPGSGTAIRAGQQVASSFNPEDNSLDKYDSNGNLIYQEQRNTKQIGNMLGSAGMAAGNAAGVFAMGGMNNIPNAEIEKQENVVAPNGKFLQVNGSSHEEGGVPVNLPGNSMIFSDRLKLGKKTFAELNKVNNTSKEDKILESNKYGNTSKRTAELMKFAKNKNSEELFGAQEALKQAKVEAYAKKMGVALPQAQEAPQEPTQFPMGGVKLPMYPLGGGTDNTKFTPAQKQQAYTDSMTLYKSGFNKNIPNWQAEPGFNDAVLRLNKLNGTPPQSTDKSAITYDQSYLQKRSVPYAKPVAPEVNYQNKPSTITPNYPMEILPMKKLEYPEMEIKSDFKQVPANKPSTIKTNIVTGPNYSYKEYKQGNELLDRMYFDPKTQKEINVGAFDEFKYGGRKLPKFWDGGMQNAANNKGKAYSDETGSYDSFGNKISDAYGEVRGVDQIRNENNFKDSWRVNGGQGTAGFNDWTTREFGPGKALLKPNTYNYELPNPTNEERYSNYAKPTQKKEVQLTNDSLQSSYGPDVLPWNRSNDSGNSAAYDNTVNPQQFQEVTSNSKSNIGSPKVTDPDSNKFDWKGLGSNIAMGLANNAGNIYNLSRYDKPEVESYERMKATYLDPSAALRDAEAQTRRAEYNVRGASGGNAGTYLSNRVALNAQNTINKARIHTDYQNANAGISNSVGQYNNELARQEVIANAQHRARNRSGKGEAIGSLGSNVANQMMDNKKGNMDPETLQLMMKYYNDTPEFQRIMKEYKDKKKSGE